MDSDKLINHKLERVTVYSGTSVILDPGFLVDPTVEITALLE